MVNVFVTNPDPKQAALELSDRLVPRMALEAAEVLCGAQWNHILGDRPHPDPAGFKRKRKEWEPPWMRNLAQRKHPASLWAGETSLNYHWVLRWYEELCHEYHRRFPDKDDIKAYTVCHKYLHEYKKRIPSGPLRPFVCFTEYPEIKSLGIPATGKYKVLMVYKYAYAHKYAPTWSNRDLPVWLHDPRIHRWLQKTYGDPVRELPAEVRRRTK